MAKTLLSQETIVKSVGGSANAYKFKLEVIENSTNVTNNTSNITVNHYGASYSSSWKFSGFSAPKSTITVDGTEKASGQVSSITSTTYKLLSTWAGNITHNNDGKKTLEVKASFGPATTSYLPAPNVIDSAVVLSTIPRKSSVSASNTKVESVCAITISRASSSLTHTLKYTFGSLSGTIATKVGTSYNWTVPKTFYAQMKDVETKNCTITCETYSGTTLIGSSTKTITISYDTSKCKSSLTVPDSVIESICEVTIKRVADSFTHTLKYAFGSLSGTIATKVGTSYDWTIPKSFYAQIPKAKSGKCTFTCETYNGTTLIGSTTTTVTLSCDPVLCAPTISIEAIDTNTTTVALTGSNIKFVKGYSNAKITPTTSAKNSATISKIVINGTTTTGAVTINGIATDNITATVTDSRGFTSSARIVLTMINYVPLTCSLTAKRDNPTSDKVTLTISGNYFNGSFGTTANTLALTYKYLKDNGSWSSAYTVNATKSGNKYTASVTINASFSYQKAYKFIAYAQDKLLSINSGTKIVTRGLAPFEIYQECVKINGFPYWLDSITTANTVLDNYTKTGIYYFDANFTPTNIPVGVNGWLEVFGLTAAIKQIWHRLGTADANDGEMFIRTYSGGKWSKWHLIPNMPIGSVYITSTNTNPASFLGGTWTLIDKEFAPVAGTSGGITSKSNSTNTSYYSRSGHTLNIETSITPNVAVGDTAIELANLDLATLGITRLTNTLRIPAFSDGGNCIVMLTISTAGVISSVDVVGVDSMPANSNIQITTTTTIHYTHMVDSACSKFYWKRTA